MSARLAIVVVNYGSSALLEENLAPTAASVPAARVVVVDNHTTPDEADRVTALAADHGWTALLRARNEGFGAAVDVGARRAFADGADRVLVLNPDATIDAASIALLEDAVRGDVEAIASPVIRTGSGKIWFDGADLYLDEGETRGRSARAVRPDSRTVPWLSGACLLLPREVYERLGGFDPGFFLYWEDVDLSWRAAQAGVALLVVDGASAVHDAGGTQERTGHRGKSRTYYYYNARNRLLFAARNLDADDIRRWLRATPRVSWAILMRGGRRQLLADPGLLVALIRGAREGRRYARAALSDRAAGGRPGGTPPRAPLPPSPSPAG